MEGFENVTSFELKIGPNQYIHRNIIYEHRKQ